MFCSVSMWQCITAKQAATSRRQKSFQGGLSKVPTETVCEGFGSVMSEEKRASISIMQVLFLEHQSLHPCVDLLSLKKYSQISTHKDKAWHNARINHFFQRSSFKPYASLVLSLQCCSHQLLPAKSPVDVGQSGCNRRHPSEEVDDTGHSQLRVVHWP